MSAPKTDAIVEAGKDIYTTANHLERLCRKLEEELAEARKDPWRGAPPGTRFREARNLTSDGPPLPLSANELMMFAECGRDIPVGRALATFAEENNWVQIYGGRTSDHDYFPKECEWAFIGPVTPPFELAQNALNPPTVKE